MGTFECTTLTPLASEPAAIVQNTGRSFPLGATLVPGGANFSVFSKHAWGIDLLFFDNEDDAYPAAVIPIEPVDHRTYHYWHVFVPGVRPGQIYGYRAHGPFAPGRGLRFDASKVLLDPYARSVVVPKSYSRNGAGSEGENTATAMKSVVVDTQSYDWEGDARLNRPSSRTCPRLYSSSEFECLARETRRLRRPDRKHTVSAGPRSNRGRTSPRVSVRCPGRPAGTVKLLGLLTSILLFAAPGVQFSQGPVGLRG